MPDFFLAQSTPNNPPGTLLVPIAEVAADVAALLTPADGFELLLARTVYEPATVQTVTTTSATMVDVDATNLAVSFTVPATGAVRVVLDAVWRAPKGANAINFFNGITCQPAWGVRQGTVPLPDAEGTSVGLILADSGTAFFSQADDARIELMMRLRPTLFVSGLAAGANVTWKFAHRRVAGAALPGSTVRYGGELGPAVMEVWSTA